MFYRRKILLSLLEACGGRLNRTDMEKLLFAYCKEREVNYYDFFPYQFGCFSFLSYQDKRVLTQQGFLADDDAFVLQPRKSVFADIETDDKHLLLEFARRNSTLRGDVLVRDLYLRYPYYASRSKIKERILTNEELKLVERSTPHDSQSCLFTIGYEGLTIDGYIDKLIRHSISIVIDVRRNPLSMKYGFSKTRFREYLERAGLAYEHIPQLGIASAQRRHLETEADYQSLFENYARILPRSSASLLMIQHHISKYGRVALTCFESMATSCHRHKITEYFQASNNWNVPVVHIC